jgi:hypothetical protein
MEKYMKLQLFFTLALILQLSTPSTAQSDDTVADFLPIPYFVDGVRCEGFNFGEVDTALLSRATQKIINSTKHQEDCESFLGLLGIRKLSWIPTEEFELLADRIKNQNVFDEVEVSLKKSEHKNHVHVFVRAKRKFFSNKSIAYRYSFANAAQPRQTHFLSGEWRSVDAQPLNEKYFRFESVITRGNSLLSPSAQIPPGSQDSERHILRGEAYSAFNFNSGGSQRIWESFRLNSNINIFWQTEGFPSGTVFENSLVFVHAPYRGLLGTVEFGPSLKLYSLTNSSNPAGSDSMKTGAIPGFRWNQKQDSGTYQHSLNLSYFDADRIDYRQFRFSFASERQFQDSTWPSAWGLKLDFEDVKNALQPTQYFGLTTYTALTTELHLVSRLSSDGKMKLKSIIGSEMLRSERRILPKNNEVIPNNLNSSNYLELAWTHSMPEWDIKLSGKYFFDRSY